MTERTNISSHWEIAPMTMQRLWPLIDVYGRVERALRGQAALLAPVDGLLVRNGSAA